MAMVFSMAADWVVGKPRQKQIGQKPPGNRAAACQRIHSEVFPEVAIFAVCPLRTLDEEV